MRSYYSILDVYKRQDKDSESIWADFSILKKDGEYYGRLDYDNSMIRYAGDRFLNIELILEDESGLKIPKSSVVEKEFFVVPSEYILSLIHISRCLRTLSMRRGRRICRGNYLCCDGRDQDSRSTYSKIYTKVYLSKSKLLSDFTKN